MASNFNKYTQDQQPQVEFSLNGHKRQSSYTGRKSVIPDYKNQQKSLRWYCQICDLTLTSRIQAQEHFFGRRHQNLVKTKNPYSHQNELKITELRQADKKRLVVFERFQNPSKSSFDENFGFGNEIFDSCDVIPPPAGRDNILETVIKSDKKTFYSSDLSIYRTPSGKYYCQPCNTTVNSQAQFLQHSESRKHKQKASRR